MNKIQFINIFYIISMERGTATVTRMIHLVRSEFKWSFKNVDVLLSIVATVF